METQQKRWRLILGQAAEKNLAGADSTSLLSEEELLMDEALAALYDPDRTGGLGQSGGIRLAKWLGDVRASFPDDIVSVIQNDAIERKGLSQLLFEPETLRTVKPSIEMVAALMALKGKIPERTKDAARELVRSVVEDIKKLLENDIRRAVKGALNRRERTLLPGGPQSIDWNYTIKRNLKNYQPDRKTIIPERFYFFDRKKNAHHWTIILDIDQSGSMANSVIYASIIGSIFASIPALKTHVVAFDDKVVDLTEQANLDPVDLLFGIQLGGGTDINKSLAYCQAFIEDPSKTIFIVVTDLYEGGNQAAMLRRMKEMHESGVKVLTLLALSDQGVPSYDQGNATKLAAMGIPCFGCSPNLLPELLEDILKGNSLNKWAKGKQ
ncbi:VWA domain-containing protein [Neobacillus sp. YIM B06451]|uniref:VWA domain-containing protein n=1 Tax=Neobacillus sp. YIM B06451 TaxID=3070994 RepID=UPI00292D1145|nr:VWA domain-containing protein [Neobacillus sp. YIM B06451]